MAAEIGRLNLLVAWLWIAAGLAFGLYLGMNFHRDDWMGGYMSLRRRLYRLAHISFFGLGILNLLFYMTLQVERLPHLLAQVASDAFVLGALSMPVCCLAMAHAPRLRLLFGVPVASLMLAGGLTLWGLVQ